MVAVNAIVVAVAKLLQHAVAKHPLADVRLSRHAVASPAAVANRNPDATGKLLVGCQRHPDEGESRKGLTFFFALSGCVILTLSAYSAKCPHSPHFAK